MSTVKLLSRRESLRDEECLDEDEECLDDEEECFDELFSEEWCRDELDDLDDDFEEDFSLGTSRMFRTRPVVGSVVEACPGSWET
jgi:hypothetical protein